MGIRVTRSAIRLAQWMGPSILACGLWTHPLGASVGVSPAYVEVELDKTRPAGRFLISNLGDQEERYRINALHFVYTESGGLQQSQTGDYSVAPWIIFNPKELVLPPKSQKAVRFAITPRGKLEDGEYWAAMELESLNISEVSAKDEKSGKAVRLKAISTIMSPIFGVVGKVRYEGRIKQIQLGQGKDGSVYVRVLVAATGTGRIGASGQYEIRNEAGRIVAQGPMGKGYVLRGRQRWLTRKLDTGLTDGTYTVKVTVEATHMKEPLIEESVLSLVNSAIDPNASTPSDPTESTAAPQNEQGSNGVDPNTLPRTEPNTHG